MSTREALPAPTEEPGSLPHDLLRAVVVLALLFLFLIGVKTLGDGFKLLGRDVLDVFFSATANPFIALMVGVLATTLVQSSSVSTSMIVALVAAPENPLPIDNAIPMVMGANIGTTVTNTIVSLGHVGRPQEFRRAFSTATCHDFFNFIAVGILLPMELMTGFLQRSAAYIADYVSGVGGVKYESPIKAAIKTGAKPIKELAHALFESDQGQGILLILISGGLIFGALYMLVKVMRGAMQSRIERMVNRFFGKAILASLAVGAIVTVMVQSSSITTSLLVPLAGAGVITVRQAFPITVGANVGTTITALLASLAATGENALAGLTVALVHLLFNLSATLMIMPIPAIRDIPVRLAEALAEIAVKSKKWALFYVVGLFFLLPALFAFLFR